MRLANGLWRGVGMVARGVGSSSGSDAIGRELPYVWRFLTRLGLEWRDRLDVMEHAFSRLDAVPANRMGWLGLAARRVMAIRPRMALIGTSDTSRERLISAMTNLSLDSRIAYVLFELEGQDPEKIASELGFGIDRVQQLLAIAHAVVDRALKGKTNALVLRERTEMLVDLPSLRAFEERLVPVDARWPAVDRRKTDSGVRPIPFERRRERRVDAFQESLPQSGLYELSA